MQLEKFVKVKKLAIQRIKKQFNTRELSKKLDDITAKVIDRGVYVVDRTGKQYTIKNYFSNKVVLDAVPFAKTAKRIASVYNMHKTREEANVSLQPIYNAIDHYHKHKNDIIFYEHTLRTATDEIRLAAAEARLEIAQMYLDSAEKELAFYT